MVNSRSKGMRGEYQGINLLQPIVNKVCDDCGCIQLRLERNLHQRYQKKEYDIKGIPWMALEIKFQEDQSGIEGWWRQVRAATREGQTSVLLYKQSRRPWMARVQASVRVAEKGSPVVIAPVTMSEQAFLVWFENRLRWELQGRAIHRSKRQPIVTSMFDQK